MANFSVFWIVILVATYASVTDAFYEEECGPYGFTCERTNKVRLCDGPNLIGPSFKCPLGTFCNEESTDVCEDAINYIEPLLAKKLRCRRNERVANPSVPGCKGYILCVANGNHFQAIKFNCSGNTVFNGVTRTCTAPTKYKCPLGNTTKTTPELYTNNRKDSNVEKPYYDSVKQYLGHRAVPIECKNYKFRLTQDDGANSATYFCPPRPVQGESSVRCTIFSNKFCITLERDEEDQFVLENGTPYRRPRIYPI